MKNKFSIVKLFFVFVIPLFLFQNCSENMEEGEINRPEDSINVTPEQAYPNFIGEIVTINYRGVDLKVMKKGNEYIFQGDIIIAQEDLDKDRDKSFNKSAVESGSAYRWPCNIVYYTINNNLPSQNRVADAIAHWEANTSLTFVQRTTQSDYIEFISAAAGSCYSDWIGKKGGRQEIGLGSGCSTGNTIHEIGHAIGFFHEQTRQDRDNHVQIHYNNIISGATTNFDRYTTRTSTGEDIGSFDFGSIMMYGSDFFSSNGQPTITKLDGSTFNVQRNGLSAGDIVGANYLYPKPTISGSQLICGNSTKTYTLTNGGSSVTWQVPSYLQILSQSNTGITVRPTSSTISGSGYVRAITSCSTVQKNIWVGTQYIEDIQFSNGIGEEWYFCSSHTNNQYDLYPKIQGNTYQVRLLSFPSLNVLYTSSTTTSSFGTLNYTPSPGWYVFEARMTNSCGTSQWLGYEVEFVDCNQGGGQGEEF
ncbi:M12 family metallopeptidase [Flavivirga abyssicola]|uniref:M12 family metallopeptidase n=1 Tax=Flavivirga abyssicola TaxID=3063533 RepID=UPI0026E05519|nr:M12 family metallopeptidase [Flavivirga sp. MEBiC07777]WVK14494.1 M12 family metallopeptidase [Flavivirga sp. MEBiC07777]